MTLSRAMPTCRRMTGHRWATAIALLVWVVATSARAEERQAVLTVLNTSFVSFQNEAAHSIPGGTIRFRLGSPGKDGEVLFRIEPGDVQMAPIPIGRGAHGKYELAAATSGRMRRGASGLELTFPARIRATTLPAAGGPRSVEYDLV